MKSPSKKVVWQCINYIERDANTGKRCGAKAVDDEILKVSFVKVYNEDFKKNNISGLANRIAALEGDISGLISMKLHKESDDDAYNREYQKLNRELTDLKIQKDELDKNRLKQTKDISKMIAVKDIIGDGSKPLSAFDDDLFEAMVEKVIIRSTEFEFYFESGQVINLKAG